MGSIEVISSRFKNQYPDGKIAIVVNGDMSSYLRYSLDSLDRGHLIYKTLSELAEKYFVVYTFGNHDAFDWNDSQLFLDQALLLKEGGVNLVVGNAEFYPEYSDLFAPYADLVNSSGKIIRFIGYTLPGGGKSNKLNKFQNRGPKIFKSLGGINLNNPLKKANRQRKINAIVVSMHLGISKVKWHVSHLTPSVRKKLKLVFAGHDHQREMTKINNIHVIDSGAYFHFSTVLFNDKGRVLAREFFDEDRQKNLSALMNLNSLEARLVAEAQEALSDLIHLKNSRGKKVFRMAVSNGTINTLREEKKPTKNNKPRCVKSFQNKRRSPSTN